MTPSVGYTPTMLKLEPIAPKVSFCASDVNGGVKDVVHSCLPSWPLSKLNTKADPE